MKNVYIKPVGLTSTAMHRVVRSLVRRKPDSINIVDSIPEADLQVHHIIGKGADVRPGDVVIQYCLKSAHHRDTDYWSPIWQQSRFVWSYYDVPAISGVDGFSFMYAPLGVEPTEFFETFIRLKRRNSVMTSGYVTGNGAEAIEEVALAAAFSGLPHVHLGPAEVSGMTRYPKPWRHVHGISDDELRQLYCNTEWVSALRFVEGFELPALEALMCGARPLVFDREEMIHWYEGHAAFVPECSGEELIDQLLQLFQYKPKPVTNAEKEKLLLTFNWDVIAAEFWERVL